MKNLLSTIKQIFDNFFAWLFGFSVQPEKKEKDMSNDIPVYFDLPTVLDGYQSAPLPSKKNVWTGLNKEASSPAEKWMSREEGEEKPFMTSATKLQAIAAGRERAIRNQSEHFIQKRDGTIGTKNSYGNDPKEIKG